MKDSSQTKADTGRPDDLLRAFGYTPQLRRRLRFFSLFAVAFSVISISTGLFLNYGFALQSFGPASIWTWPIAFAGQLVMALLIAELSTKIPVAGYAYQWGARLVNSAYGWFVAAFALIYMTITVGAIILLGVTPLMFVTFGITNASGPLTLSIAIILLVVAIVLNVISVQLVARVNNIAVFTEILGTVVFATLLLILWGLHGSHGSHSLAVLGTTTNLTRGPAWYEFALGGLIGIYTLVGFELSADLTEEALESQHSVPRGIIVGLIVAGVLGMIALIAFDLGIVNLHAVETSSEPLVTIGSFWLPFGVMRTIIFFVGFSMWALCVVTIAAQARLVFSLGRDNMLPFSPFLRSVNSDTRTPVNALIVGGVISVALLVFGYTQANAFTTLIGATSLAPYLVYFLVVVSYIRKRSVLATVPGGFNLGRWGVPLMWIGLCWIVVACAVLILPAPFHGSDEVVGGGFILAAAWYVFALRRRFAAGTAGVTLFSEKSEAAKVLEREFGVDTQAEGL